jgi:hypothetical protein
MSQYIYDKNEFRFKKARTSVWAVIRKILVFFVITIALAFLYYVLFALVFSMAHWDKLSYQLIQHFAPGLRISKIGGAFVLERIRSENRRPIPEGPAFLIGCNVSDWQTQIRNIQQIRCGRS